jgi:hypothetical protein
VSVECEEGGKAGRNGRVKSVKRRERERERERERRQECGVERWERRTVDKYGKTK